MYHRGHSEPSVWLLCELCPSVIALSNTSNARNGLGRMFQAAPFGAKVYSPR